MYATDEDRLNAYRAAAGAAYNYKMQQNQQPQQNSAYTQQTTQR